jgi:NADH:ubiquinone oxidoreductase subunit 5 (subunit L)/multisubunit Na+/H+ antiporter MnhA subunit
LEVRFREDLTASRYLGLAEQAPRLAVFFIELGLALVGLPGTLSFCSQDLLIHGTLETHPQTGLLLPIATAMNAVSVFRLFARLFLGKRRTGFTVMADALPRREVGFSHGSLVRCFGRLFPNAIVARQAAEAEAVEQAIGVSATVATIRSRDGSLYGFQPKGSHMCLHQAHRGRSGSSLLLASELNRPDHFWWSVLPCAVLLKSAR